MPPQLKLISPDELVSRTHPAKDGGFSLPYRLYVPRDYVQTRRYPLVVVLHGAGERGADNALHLGNGVLGFCDASLQKRHPAFVIYPQCPEGAQWVEAPWGEGSYDSARVPLSRPLGAVMELADALAAEFTIDPSHLLVAGLSMGGYGTFDLATRFPQRVAGAIAICGGGDPTAAARAKDVPLWAFHGSADAVVPVKGSRLMIDALRKAGGRPKYTEWKGMDHHVWERVFADRAVLTWLLSRKSAAAARKAGG